MKRISFIIISLGITIQAFAQSNSNPWPTSGNVGIGTSTPLYKLDVVKLSAGSALNLTGQALGTRNDAGIDFSAHNSVTVNYAKIGLQISTGTTGAETGGLTFSTINFGTLSEKMFIAGSGNVGIGTTTPVTLLNIAVPSPKATVAGNIASFLSSNDATNPFGLRTMIYGAASITDRYVTLQTTDYALTDGGSLVLQPSAGNVSVGTTDAEGYKFAVNGSAIATSFTVKLNANWPDYVFKPDYKLPSLTEVRTYVDQNHHLPEIPSEQEIARNGQNLGDMNKLLLKKVEELTMYLIEKDKQKEEQDEKLKAQQLQIDKLGKAVEELTRKSNGN